MKNALFHNWIKLSLQAIVPLCFSQLATAQMNSNATPTKISPEAAKASLVSTGQSIETEPIRRIACQNNGRIKPFDTLARESVLYLTGAAGRFGLTPVQFYLAIIIDPQSGEAPLIEVRSPNLRARMGFSKTERFLSLRDLETSPLSNLAEPALRQQDENSRALTPDQKEVLEAYNQLNLIRAIQSGNHLYQSIDFVFLKGQTESGHNQANGKIRESLQNYLKALSMAQAPEARIEATNLVSLTRTQETPELFQHFLKKLDLEVFYNDARLFFWASILAILLSIVLLTPNLVRKIPHRAVLVFYAVPVLLIAVGLGARVYITLFAPVTNMYGTMIWVSLGVSLFSAILFGLYKNRVVAGLCLMGTGLILLLTEKTPLILSPDMDPIVAVLRNNFWLSTHVTTITISYAAFTIAMLLGNMALIRVFTHRDNHAFFREYSHYAYRMIQLGCFLLTVGIILGGVWADYSWGRFWGWDPKETWALIADIGFLAILHAKHVGWVSNFTLLAFSPVAYLLVIMAWYGVNFILAAGLHSYGFSSGGAIMVSVFVSVQLGLLAAALWRARLTGQRQVPQ